MSPLHRAIQIAVEAHLGQDDPPGEPYILHPMRVMLSLPESDHDLRCVAILHDALERTKLPLAKLKEAKFDSAIIRSIGLLTHDKERVSYAEYVVALKPDRMARAVKLADLMDNSNLRYVDFPIDKPKKGRKRVMRYAVSYQFLTDQIDEATYRQLMKIAE